MNCYIQHLSKGAMLSFKNTLLKGGNKPLDVFASEIDTEMCNLLKMFNVFFIVASSPQGQTMHTTGI